MPPLTKIQAIECPKCGYIMYSRARHDFRYCPCESVFVDGGLEYIRWGGEGDIKGHTLELPLTPQELYDDWNKRTDKFGSIAPCGQPLSSCSYASPPMSSGTCDKHQPKTKD